jgi:histidinol-phosphate/aromatic aminotransferase/cobyric acid decarboxylase-like protein
VAAGGPPRCLRITVGLEHENDAVVRVLADYVAR